MPKAKPDVRRSARLQDLDKTATNQTKKSAIQKSTNTNSNRTPRRLLRSNKGPDTPQDEDQDSNQGESESVSEQEENSQENVEPDDQDNQEENQEEEEEQDEEQEKSKSNDEKEHSDAKEQSQDENQSGEHSVAEDEPSGSAKSDSGESSSSKEESGNEEQEQDEESDTTQAGKYKLRKRKHSSSQSSPSKSLQRLLRKNPRARKRMRTTMMRSPKKEHRSLRPHERFSARRGHDLSGEERLSSSGESSSSKEDDTDNQTDTSRGSNNNDPYLDKALRRPGLRLTRQRVMEIEKLKKNPSPQSTVRAKKTSQRSPVKRTRRSTREKKSISRFDPLNYRRGAATTPTSVRRFSVTSGRRSRKSRRRDTSSSSDSSDSSSDSSSSDDDHKKHKYSLPLPINMPFGQLSSKAKSSTLKADIDPMIIDSSISWDSVGGLDSHIRSLKEMVMFPLLYPEIFDKFAIAPPKGVLFYGPPGTGKTLVARALANTCSQTGQKVAFFMRKGADCLSKWVGEAERQLRLLFQQAYLMQPSIIFFDEIDGLAPVRSSKQDQIHSSIVSTLLALMDGLDARGQIIIIGATNRIDAIDPALRRPGRFDREFLFTLPSRASRRQILSIHCSKWEPKPSEQLLDELAECTVGYCGADLKALCTEASLQSLRRHYPQIYSSNEKLLIDVNSIQITREDFLRAMRSITPAAHRAAITYAKPLPREITPLLERHMDQLKRLVLKIFPISQPSLMPNHTQNAGYDNNNNVQPQNEFTSNNNNMSEYTEDTDDFGVSSGSNFVNQRMGDHSRAALYRPRLLIHGEAGMGQSYLSSALLYILEQFPISCLDMSTLLSNSASRTIEEAFVADFKESLRKVPGIIFIPHIDSWWEAASFTLRSSFINNVLHDIECNTPVLLLATSDTPLADLPAELQNLFGTENSFEITQPDEVSRRNYFQSLVEDMKAVKNKNNVPFHEKYPPLPKAPAVSAKPLTEDEHKSKTAEEEGCLRELRIFLRDCISKLYKERKYHIFFKPVNADQYPEYYEAVKDPIDLNMVLDKIDNYEYTNLQLFLDDINTIVQNAINHNPYGDNLRVESRAKAMQDIVLSRSKRLAPEIIAVCDRITTRKKNNAESEVEDGSLTPRRWRRKKADDQSAAEEANKESDPMQLENNTNNDPASHSIEASEEYISTKKIDSPKVTETPTRELKKSSSSGKLKSPEHVVVVIDSIPKSPGTSTKATNGHSNVPSILENANLIFDENEAMRLQRAIIKNTAKSSLENLMEIRAKVYQRIFAHRSSNDKRALLSEVKLLLSELNMNDTHSPRKQT